MNDFWSWWQHLPQNIDPVIFSIGSFRLQYYGLMYIVAFALTFVLAMYRIKREDRFEVSTDQLKDVMTYMIVGLIIGARLGYVVFIISPIISNIRWKYFCPFHFQTASPLPAYPACRITAASLGWCWRAGFMCAKRN